LLEITDEKVILDQVNIANMWKIFSGTIPIPYLINNNTGKIYFSHRLYGIS